MDYRTPLDPSLLVGTRARRETGVGVVFEAVTPGQIGNRIMAMLKATADTADLSVIATDAGVLVNLVCGHDGVNTSTVGSIIAAVAGDPYASELVTAVGDSSDGYVPPLTNSFAGGDLSGGVDGATGLQSQAQSISAVMGTIPGDASSTPISLGNGGGDDLLDFTNPLQPIVKKTGLYVLAGMAVPANSGVSPDQSKQDMLVGIQLGVSVAVVSARPGDSTDAYNPYVAFTLVAPMLATEDLAITAYQNSGNDMDLSINYLVLTKIG